jgi:ABC-type multidrug transport system fused ATPase/permease subunit
MSAITPKSPSESDYFILPRDYHSIQYLGIAILGIAWIGGTCMSITITLSFISAVFFQVTWINGFWQATLLITAIVMALSTIIITIIASVEQAHRKVGRGRGAWIEKVANLSIIQHILLFALLGKFSMY